MKKLLFYCTAAGPKYIGYIAPFLYCLRRAIPYADAIVDVRDEPDEKTEAAIAGVQSVLKPGITINYNCFQNIPMSNDVMMYVRWAVFRPQFEDYEFILHGDVDVMYAIEKPDLLEQRLRVLGDDVVSTHDGLDCLPVRCARIAVPLMIRTKPWFEAARPVMIELMEALLQGRYPDWQDITFRGDVENQTLFATMMKRAGVRFPKHNFWAYHGFHIGHARVEGRLEAFFGETDGERIEHKRYARDLVPVFKTPEFSKLITNGEVAHEFMQVVNAWSKCKNPDEA